MLPKIDLNRLGSLICQQAKEKGWGHSKDTLVVSEKMILISTEITELQRARNSKTVLPKDTMFSEYADVLMRTLHLGTAWGVDFNKEFKYKSKIKSSSKKFNLLDLLYFHNLVSKGYDYYRHKNTRLFKKYLYLIAHEIVLLSQTEDVDIEQGTLAKIDINKDRIWSRLGLNGNYNK